MVRYENGKLCIEIESNDPAADHAYLMQAINIAFRLVSTLDDGHLRHFDRENLIPLSDLLDHLLPKEMELERIYKDPEKKTKLKTLKLVG